MTLILDRNLDSMKVYMRIKNEVCIGQGIQKLEAVQDTQSHGQTRLNALPPW